MQHTSSSDGTPGMTSAQIVTVCCFSMRLLVQAEAAVSVLYSSGTAAVVHNSLAVRLVP